MTEPTDAELIAMWQIHAADIGGSIYYARAVLAKWGPSAPQAEQQAAPKATQVDPDKLMRDCLALLESFDYEDDEDSQSKAFFNAHINADWFFHVKHSIERQLEAKAAPQQEAREPLTDEQIQDLLLCGNPTDEEMRLIRIGWDAARGIKGGQHGTE